MTGALWMTIIAIVPAAATAYDFMAGNIAYNRNGDGSTVTVTYTKFGDNYPGVKSIDVPELVTDNGTSYRVTAIDNYAFYESAALEKLTLPVSVTRIGSYAAFGCAKLNSVEWGSNVATIGQYAFSETALSSVNLPLAVTVVGDYAFAACKKLTLANVNNGVKQLGRSAFYDCSALAKVTLGVKLENIGTSAFGNCSALKQINCNMVEPSHVKVDENAFDGVDKATCQLSVPRGTLALYKAAAVWKDFAKIDDNYQGYLLQLSYTPRSETVSTLGIDLLNDTEVTALQCDIVLPSPMRFVRVNGDYEVELNNERRGRDHSVTINATSNTTMTLLVSSPTGTKLKGNEGRLLNVGLDISAITRGEYTIAVRNVTIAKPDGEMVYLTDAVLPVKFTQTYLLGDANGDGVVDVADYVVTANKLVGKAVTSFINRAADVNRNGSIDLGDLVGISLRAIGKITPEEMEY